MPANCLPGPAICSNVSACKFPVRCRLAGTNTFNVNANRSFESYCRVVSKRPLRQSHRSRLYGQVDYERCAVTHDQSAGSSLSGLPVIRSQYRDATAFPPLGDLRTAPDYAMRREGVTRLDSIEQCFSSLPGHREMVIPRSIRLQASARLVGTGW
jgi:hypothetical protein